MWTERRLKVVARRERCGGRSQRSSPRTIHPTGSRECAQTKKRGKKDAACGMGLGNTRLVHVMSKMWSSLKHQVPGRDAKCGVKVGENTKPWLGMSKKLTAELPLSGRSAVTKTLGGFYSGGLGRWRFRDLGRWRVFAADPRTRTWDLLEQPPPSEGRSRLVLLHH